MELPVFSAVQSSAHGMIWVQALYCLVCSTDSPGFLCYDIVLVMLCLVAFVGHLAWFCGNGHQVH